MKKELKVFFQASCFFLCFAGASTICYYADRQLDIVQTVCFTEEYTECEDKIPYDNISEYEVEEYDQACTKQAIKKCGGEK